MMSALIATRVDDALRTPQPTLELLLGGLVSLEKIVPYGRLHFRRLQMMVLSEIRLGHFFRLICLPNAKRADLLW